MNPDQQGLAGVIRSHPVLAFLVWFFTVGQAFAFAPLYLDTSVPDQWFIIGSTLVGLLLPAVIITQIVDGPDGLRALARRIVRVRASLGLYLTGLVLMPVLAVGMAVVVLGAPDVPASTVVTALGSALFVSLLVGFLLNNLWEEVAWMGFVQARLQHRHGAMRAALIVAPLFALQHVALVVQNDPSSAVVILAVFILVNIPFRAFNGWLYNRTGGSLFLVGLVHALSNAVAPGAGFSSGYLRVLYPGDAETVGLFHILALAVMGLVVMVATRSRLGLAARPVPAEQGEPALVAGSAR